jgi:putative hemolysin
MKEISKPLLIVLTIIFMAVVCIMTYGCGRNIARSNSTKENMSANKTGALPTVSGIEVSYCEGIGYKYEYRQNESTGEWEEYCRLNATLECPAWDFVSGECHRELSLCGIEGYIPKIGVVKRENYNETYPICIFPDGSYCKEIDFFNRNCHVKW